MSYITISPVCVSCQSSIGQFYEAYQDIKNRRCEEYMENKGYAPSDNSAMEEINMGDFLDKMGIKNICCRQSIMGHNPIVQNSI